MPVQNSEIAKVFEEMADLLAIENANQFRVRAYREAARTIASLPKSAADMVERGEDLTTLPGIGDDLASKITEIVRTGTLSKLAEVEERTPPQLVRMLRISGLGPKRVATLNAKLGIQSVGDLERAAREGRIRQLQGFGPRTEQKILEDIERSKGAEERTLLMVAEQAAQPLISYLRQTEGVQNAVVAGSYRRRKETVGDLDILVTGSSAGLVMERFVHYEDVDRVVSQGDTRSTVILRSGLQVDLRAVADESYGAALLYFTGSKAHGIALRNMALHRGLKINEYGMFRDEKRVGGETEEQMYGLLQLPYIPPELREDRGEIEAAQEGKLPELVSLEDIRGDLQVHTGASDGRGTIRDIAARAQQRGYQYVAITDHSKYMGITHGLGGEDVFSQVEEIDRLNERLEGITVLKGLEVDILEDGSLALPDEVLSRLDLTICSVHVKLDLPREKQTERIIRAMDNPYFSILAHPTGRLIGERRASDLDMERIIEAALERGCFLEVNAQPDRLDLSDVHVKMAKEMGLKLAISTDAHNVDQLDYMRYGVGQARRGWLEPDEVLNTRDLDQLRTLLKRS
jgi:DNA polymerase (family 10)